MTALAANDRELLLQLLEDVRQVEDQFLGILPKPAVARTLFTTILRKWIANGDFYKAKKLIIPNQVSF
jgi:hypothetical protein